MPKEAVSAHAPRRGRRVKAYVNQNDVEWGLASPMLACCIAITGASAIFFSMETI